MESNDSINQSKNSGRNSSPDSDIMISQIFEFVKKNNEKLKARTGGFSCKKHLRLQVLFAGGGEGSRTPVRKPIHTVFSGRRLPFEFSRIGADRRAPTE